MNSPRLTPILAAIAAAAVTALVVVLLTGGDDDDQPVRTVSTQSQPAGGATATAPATQDDPDDDAPVAGGSGQAASAVPSTADGLRALRTAEADGGGAADDLDREDGGAGWSVGLAGGDSVLVDADGRRVQQRFQDPDDLDDAQLAADARVGLADAIRSAERQVDGDLESADIDRDDDVANAPLVWSLSFDTATGETELVVDATTGDVSQPVED